MLVIHKFIYLFLRKEKKIRGQAKTDLKKHSGITFIFLLILIEKNDFTSTDIKIFKLFHIDAMYHYPSNDIILSK